MLKNCLIWILFLPFFVKAQSFPAKPSNYVTDETGTLSGSAQSALNTKLRAFEDSTSNQIFVYIAPTLDGRDIEGYSQELFHNWKIGQAGKNNGVLIAIFINDHKFRIQTGYGLEGALPDLLTKRIQDEIMRPQFKNGDYYKGIDLGVNELIYYSKHEYVPESGLSDDDLGSYWQSWVIGYAINVLFLALYIRNVLRKKTNKSKKQKRKEGNGELRKFILITIACIIALLPCVGAMILFFMFIFTSNFSIASGRGSYTGSSSDSSSSWSSSDSSSSYDSGSSFDGGGGGDSGGGGSSSDW